MSDYRITLHGNAGFNETHRVLRGVSHEDARTKAWVLLLDRLKHHLGFYYSDIPPHTLEIDANGSRVIIQSHDNSHPLLRLEATIFEIPGTDELYDFCREGKKIDAIKCLRRMTGQGLREAKEEVERWMPAFNS